MALSALIEFDVSWRQACDVLFDRIAKDQGSAATLHGLKATGTNQGVDRPSVQADHISGLIDRNENWISRHGNRTPMIGRL
jgi:hypothetical protein